MNRQFSRKILPLAGLFGIICVCLTACSSNISSSVSSQQLMPKAIVVRNNSGTDFASVSLAALPGDNSTARAFGELAPVPDRVEQVYGRSYRAPPLPNVVEFRLRTIQGQTVSRLFQLATLRQEAEKIPPPYQLVFILKPGGDIQMLLESQ